MALGPNRGVIPKYGIATRPGDRKPMVRVSGTGLSANDKLFIRYATHYTLDYLMQGKSYSQHSVCIKVSTPTEQEAEEGTKGTCLFRGEKNGNRMRCDVWLLESLMRRSEKVYMWNRFEEMVPALVHELMHVKQYFTGELVDVSKTKYRFRGKVFDNADDNDLDAYFNQEYEVQAYGHERHLSERFRRHWVDMLAKAID